MYNHFNSDGHGLEDMCIMPIEEVVVNILMKLVEPEDNGQRKQAGFMNVFSIIRV